VRLALCSMTAIAMTRIIESVLFDH
jgi:hypothetical protein